jgi:uncharacterized protein (DUF608 family)
MTEIPDPAPLPAVTRALLTRDREARRGALDPAIVNVSHTEGVPLGSLGSGFSVFGRHGFQRATFGGPPDPGPEFTEPRALAPFGFELELEDGRVRLAEDAGGSGAQHVRGVEAYAALPKAHFAFDVGELALGVVMTAYTPLLPHDVPTASLPVQIFELTVENRSPERRRLVVKLTTSAPATARDGGLAVAWPGGELAFGVEAGRVERDAVSTEVVLEPGALVTARFFLAWYVPEFRTSSPVATAPYRRHYARRFANAFDILALARERADTWSTAIDAWHAAFAVPAAMKRLWFSSLSSVVTCTLLSDDPYFFAVESPHDWVNTMDVAVYANWVYLVNWPELERLDLDMFRSVIPIEGENAGFVWHSLWSDAAHYAEEPTYVTRLRRASLWFGDRAWLSESFDRAVLAASAAYARDSSRDLLVTKTGNQSYDEWMMPGINAYVNVTWCYALHALASMGRSLDRHAQVGGFDASVLGDRARKSLVEVLWTPEGGGYFRCFERTPGASTASDPSTVFTDQLFGRWVLLVDRESADVLPLAALRSVLTTIYENNECSDSSRAFRGWVNGMLPGKQVDQVAGYHARTCWLGAELDLASLLGAVGDEQKSLEVFADVERSLDSNHLAVGEWNRAVDASGGVVVLNEWGKDTPRFPPYPRYTSSWEYLIRLLGLTLDEDRIYLEPFRTLDFALAGVVLAGLELHVRVERDWSRAVIGGKPVTGSVSLDRRRAAPHVAFVR